MLSKYTYDRFEELKALLVNNYVGEKNKAEILYDIKFKRCRIADSDHYKDPRVFMHVGCEKNIICVSSSIELLSTNNLIGLFVHEFGHIIHNDYAELITAEVNIDDISDCEIIADMIAENLFGIRIYYDSDKIQWIEILEN